MITLRKITNLLFCIGFLMAVSCSKTEDLDTVVPVDPEEEPKPDESVWSVNREDQRALNVVFFVPTDYPLEDNTLKQVSDVMLYIQSWYEVQMEAQGYGKKTFALLTDQYGAANIMFVQGKESSEFYGEKNHPILTQEVRDHLADNPDFDKSQHTLVLGYHGSKVGFFGKGKWAFASSMDYTLTDSGQTFNGFPLKVAENLGGIMHELGHGLNLPHNAEKKSELPFISLMSNGNRVYQKRPEDVFLTKSTCAILNANEVFNKKSNGIAYYDVKPNTELKDISITKDSGTNSIKISGTFISDIEAIHAYAGFNFVNENSSPPNDNYDEIIYDIVPTKKNGVYAFNFTIPYGDLFNDFQTENKDKAEITINVITENGFRMKPFSHFYTTDLATEIPNDDVIIEYEVFDFTDRSNWSITANSTTASNEDSNASTMIDGDTSSYWQSHWPYKTADRGPHEIIINTGTTTTMKGMYFLSDRTGGQQFRPKHFIIQSSADEGASWTTVKEVTVANINDAKEFRVKFDSNVTTKHVKIVVDQIYTTATSGAENLVFAEIDIIK